ARRGRRNGRPEVAQLSKTRRASLRRRSGARFVCTHQGTRGGRDHPVTSRDDPARVVLEPTGIRNGGPHATTRSKHPALARGTRQPGEPRVISIRGSMCRPRLRAFRIASSRVPTPSLRYRLRMWVFTVLGEMNNSVAIWATVRRRSTYT